MRAEPTDVSILGDVERLRDAAVEELGEVALLMNNAAMEPPMPAVSCA